VMYEDDYLLFISKDHVRFMLILFVVCPRQGLAIIFAAKIACQIFILL
jgi:hypothetical protein